MSDMQERAKNMSVYKMLTLLRETHSLSQRFYLVSEEQRTADSKRRKEIEQQLRDVGLQLAVDDSGQMIVYEG